VYAALWRVQELVGRPVSREEVRYHGTSRFYRFGGAEISESDLEKTGLVVDGLRVADTEPRQKAVSRGQKKLGEWDGVCPICGAELAFVQALNKVRCPNSRDPEHGARKKQLIKTLPVGESYKLENSSL